MKIKITFQHGEFRYLTNAILYCSKIGFASGKEIAMDFGLASTALRWMAEKEALHELADAAMFNSDNEPTRIEFVEDQEPVTLSLSESDIQDLLTSLSITQTRVEDEDSENLRALYGKILTQAKGHIKASQELQPTAICLHCAKMWAGQCSPATNKNGTCADFEATNTGRNECGECIYFGACELSGHRCEKYQI